MLPRPLRLETLILEAVLPRSGRPFTSGAAPSIGPGANEPQPVLGIAWTPLPAVLGKQLDISNGMVVESVVTGTLAEKLGLSRHDVLLELDGKSVNDSADVKTTLDPVKVGDKVTAVVLREGKRKSLEATR